MLLSLGGRCTVPHVPVSVYHFSGYQHGGDVLFPQSTAGTGAELLERVSPAVRRREERAFCALSAAK